LLLDYPPFGGSVQNFLAPTFRAPFEVWSRRYDGGDECCCKVRKLERTECKRQHCLFFKRKPILVIFIYGPNSGPRTWHPSLLHRTVRSILALQLEWYLIYQYITYQLKMNQYIINYLRKYTNVNTSIYRSTSDISNACTSK